MTVAAPARSIRAMTTTPTPVGIMCAWCRNRFEWTPGPDRTRPLYCSKYHNNLAQAHAKAKREGATPGVCPFPWKARYADNNAARAVIDANPVTKAGNRPYLCPGGEHHHIGRLKGRPFYEHHVPASNLRMTEWQGAIGLAQLARLEAQTETREANSRRLAAGLEALQERGVGVAPLRRDPRVTRWGFYMWHFRFLPEPWEGVTRDDFLRALRAEGLPGGTGHTQPLYKNPLFLDPEQALGRTGFPLRGGLYQGRMDYREVACPQTERIYATEAVHLGHPLFLGPPEDMDAILGAIEKVWRHRDALRGVPRVAASGVVLSADATHSVK